MRRLFVTLAAVLSAGLVPAGVALAAGASPLYTQVLHAYQANGRIPPCEFTSRQLESALGGVDTYGQQYYADFLGAIQAALTARAGGACSGHHRATPANGGTGGGGSGPISGAPALPSSITAPTTSGLPLPMLLLIVLGAVLGAVVAVPRWARARGWEPPSAAGWRHGTAEARYRMEGAWLELRERLRR